MNVYSNRRKNLMAELKDNSLLVLFSGVELHISADDYYPFQANRNFFYLTGLRRTNMALVMYKCGESLTEYVFIEESDPKEERWTGKMVTVDEAKEITGVNDVKFISDLNDILSFLLNRKVVENFYFDLHRNHVNDLPDYNVVRANELLAKYPGIAVNDAWGLIAKLRMVKDSEEIKLTKYAVDITGEALKNVMKTLEPGIKEYQVQANFEYTIKYLGAEGVAFPTIAGSGANGTMLHYETNQGTCENDSLILLDLGARYAGYNADITRTYPVNGKFTERQRKVYDIVLAANKAVIASAKAGMTLLELNNICKEVLAKGLIELGLIKEASEVGKYYMHSVSHQLGIDVHDVTNAAYPKLRAGSIITDEPGLYIDEWQIGIRIEDDLLITEDGCVVLSEGIIKEADDIERFMA